MSTVTIVQLLRSPEGGIRKHVVDILENLPSDSYSKVFISSFADSDRNLDYLKSKFGVEFLDLAIKDKPEFRDLLNIFKIYSFLKNKENIVLHGHGAKGGVYARICSFLLRCPNVYTPHGGSLHRVFSKFKSIVYDTIERMLISLTDKFVFESKYSANEFKNYVGNCGQKEVINYNGVSFSDSSETNLYKAGDRIKLASFGLLRQLKGHDIVIDALSILSKENFDFFYTIYGYGQEYDNLILKIKSYKLENRIKIEKYTDDILARMSKCDVVIHPSRFESFGYVPVEAMSIKVPVITSFEGGLKEVAVEGGSFICKSNSAKEYASIIRKIYRGEYDLEKMVENAHEISKKQFSVEVMVKNLDSIYKNINKNVA